MFSGYTTPVSSLPAQTIPYSEKIAKKKKWAKECVDSLEQLGRRQYYDNLRFVENYQMLNGKFIPYHYFEQDGYKYMISLLQQEFDIPSTLRHYDIISKFVNNLTEKLAEFPDIFHVHETFDDDDTNEWVRTQTDLMHQSVKADINGEIQARLLAEGVDVNKTDFSSQEEAQQYRQEIQQMEQKMEPRQISKYMNTDWKSQGEIWGQHQLQKDKERFLLSEKERKEFRDMLISDRCFRHFFITGDGYDQETWNPINTFFHVAPEIDWAQDGDYVGRIFYLTKSDIVNRYGWKMDSKQIKQLEKLDREFSNDLDFNGFPYKTYAPFEDFKSYDIVTKATGYDPINRLPIMTDDTLYALTNNLPYLDTNNGLFRVTEVYWKSLKKIGKVVYIDEETGLLTKDLVDEDFIVPENFTSVQGEYYDGNDVNTVYWTYVPEVWKGTKICFVVSDSDAIYLDLEPLEFQFKGDYNPYGAKLPVCGRTFNNRNAQSMSLVDLMKPDQFGHNVAMNQLYQLLEKETGKFMIWDANFFNTMKDWAGEDSWDKIHIIAKELGHVFGDTSPANTKGANPGNQLPREADMTLTAQIMSRAKIADFFEQKAMSRIGISQQFMGDVKATDTATGVNTATNQTQLNVQRFYTDFFEYKKRCLSMNLDIAQYTQSKQKDVLISYTQNDQNRVFIKMAGTNLLLRNLGIFVSDSQELLQQLNMLKQLFTQSNTTGATPQDLADVITAYSPSEIKAILKASLETQRAREDQMQQNELAKFKAQQEADQEKENRIDGRVDRTNATKVEVAKIMVTKAPATPEKQPQDKSLEYNKFNSKNAMESERTGIQRQANEIQLEKATNDKLLKSRELDLKEESIRAKEKVAASAVRVAKIKHKNDNKK